MQETYRMEEMKAQLAEQGQRIAALRAENEKLKAERKESAESSTTPYDDAWRTLTTTAPRLLIPVVNEVFHENFSLNAVVSLTQNEHLFYDTGGKVEKRVTDTNFSVLEKAILDNLGDGFDISEGPRKKHYVFECESKAVSSAILVRIVEYAVQSGVETATTDGITTARVYIPQTAILSLRSTKNTPSEMVLEIIMENGSGSSKVRVMKLSDYSVDAIFEKNLYLLIPFLLFNYEKRFESIKNHDEEYKALIEDVRSVYQRLDESEFPLLDAYVKSTLRAMTHSVVNALAKKYPRIQEGVNEVVGGRIIEHEALKIKREGFQEGISEGRKEGRKEGADDMLHTVAERLIRIGSDGSTIAAATGYDRSRINTIATRMNRTVSWG